MATNSSKVLHSSKIMMSNDFNDGNNTSSSPTSTSTHCEITNCLIDAQTKLEDAINKHLSSDHQQQSREEECTADTNESKKHEPKESNALINDDDDDDDDDDLAAAFFAQQAKKQQVENILPVDEWARSIIGYHENQKLNKQQHCTTKENIEMISAETNGILAKELIEIYRRIVNSD
jgi:hypothetical protein